MKDEDDDDIVVDDDGKICSVVKMKLSSFLKDENRVMLSKVFNDIVLNMSKLSGEAYLFANFHISRLLKEGLTLPIIDRNFYFRCLLGVSENNCRERTLTDEWLKTIDEFYALCPMDYKKVNVVGQVQLLADISIMMATAASNHLWLNLERRITSYISWRYPRVSKSMQKAIIVAVVKAPKANLDSIFKPVSLPKTFTSRAVERAKETFKKASKSYKQTKDIEDSKNLAKAKQDLNQEITKTNTRIQSETLSRNNQILEAKAIAGDLRGVMHLPSAGQFASKAHLTLPLYYKILNETKEAKQSRETSSQEGCKKFKGKTFTLLPVKNGFTLQYVPISSMTLCQVLKNTKLINIKGDGRDENKHLFWEKFFNLNAIETRNRRFGDRVVTDGYGVSILMNKPSCSCCKIETKDGFLKCREHIKKDQNGSWEWSHNVLIGAIDPGVTDVVTAAYTNGKTWSYSSAKYYLQSLIFTSNRRTAKWNKETETLVKNAPSVEVAMSNDLAVYIKYYLSVNDKLLIHRSQKGYRYMRFMRYIKKKETVYKIANDIAPKDKTVILGFGDWKGLGKTPISRKTCGPIQEIKFVLSKKKNVIMEEVDEYRSSKVCSCCNNVLSNMKAKRTTKRTQGDGSVKITTQKSKVHKILHCRRSSNNLGGCCGASWDRDINAARNLLVLTQCQIFGIQRPIAFCRPSSTRNQSYIVSETRSVKSSVMGDLKHLLI